MKSSFLSNPTDSSFKSKAAPLPHCALGLLMTGCKSARNTWRRSNEIKWKIVHHVGLLYECNSRRAVNQKIKNSVSVFWQRFSYNSIFNIIFLQNDLQRINWAENNLTEACSLGISDGICSHNIGSISHFSLIGKT
jgi:hypothetical protein